MRAVRCDACGAKAMIAAAQCPKCGHLFELRDGFGALLPLAYCSSCDSYYPASLGECKWCGTKPERAPVAPQIWRGIGAAALAALFVMAWVAHRQPEVDGSRLAKHIRAKAAATSEPGPPPLDTAIQQGSATVDTVTSPGSATTTASADNAARDSAYPAVSAPPTPSVASTSPPTSASPVASTPPVAIPADARPSSTSKRSPRWVSSVSRDWVVVRTAADNRSRIVASIGPNSHVQLGETRGSWRRIRARGLRGWVEPRSLFDIASAR